MKRKGLIVAALLLATPFCTAAEGHNVSNSKDVTFSIISPQDESLWIATKSHGLLRLGVTGRTFHYSSSTGDFPCDSIAALAFGPDGVLYMNDVRGGVYAYTTLSGFKEQKEIPDDVVFETPEVDETTADSGQILPTPYQKHPTWPFWVVIVLLCGYIAYQTIRRNAPAPTVKAAPEPANRTIIEQKPEPKVELKAKVAPADQEFVSHVEALVAENYADSGYSVETIADALGITRVHLNRKLKEAGAPAPKLILRKARMEKALAMLREGLPVSDVYSACGFSSASYFSSAFKEYFGYTPSDVTKPNI